MKKGIIYYFVLASVLFHLLVLLGLRHIPWQQAQLISRAKNEPIPIDIVGPLKKGKETAIPKFPEKPPDKGPAVVEAKPRKDSPKEPLMTARAAPQRQAAPAPSPPRQASPQAKPSPEPSQSKPREAEAPKPRPQEKPADTAGEVPVPQPEKAAPGADTIARATPQPERASAEPSVPAQPSPDTPGVDDAPRRLVQPSVEDLMRYAKVDRDVKRVEPEQGITLDTTDLMYTSYLQGLRRRIEMVWQYPETARQDGLQGELVMRFAIEKSGKVEAIELLKSSGYPVLDRAAEKALADASPFNPLPDSWQKERFVITGTFVYKLYGLYIR